MSQPTNLYSTYDQVGKKESVDSVITSITPFDTPMFTMMKTEKVSARKFDWQEDSLPAAAVNAQLEGATATAEAQTATTLRTNNTQILTKTFDVSGTAEAVALYGRAKESAHLLAKNLKAIKRDLEHALVGVDQAAVDSGEGTARKMASVINQISNDIDADATAADSAAERNAPYTGTALIEDMLTDAGNLAYDNGSDVDTFMVTPSDSMVVAGFTASSGRNREIAQGKTLVNAVDLYVSPFGEYRVILNRHLKSDTALLLDPSMFRTCVLRPFTRELLSKTGDSDKHFILGEYSVKHMAHSDSVKIINLGS